MDPASIESPTVAAGRSAGLDVGLLGAVVGAGAMAVASEPQARATADPPATSANRLRHARRVDFRRRVYRRYSQPDPPHNYSWVIRMSGLDTLPSAISDADVATREVIAQGSETLQVGELECHG